MLKKNNLFLSLCSYCFLTDNKKKKKKKSHDKKRVSVLNTLFQGTGFKMRGDEQGARTTGDPWTGHCNPSKNLGHRAVFCLVHGPVQLI